MIRVGTDFLAPAQSRRNSLTIAFIGAGNMAISLLRGLVNNGMSASNQSLQTRAMTSALGLKQ